MPDRSNRLTLARAVGMTATAMLGGLSGGCAARVVVPVAVSQPGDPALDCAQITTEMRANRAAAERYALADKRLEQSNVAAGVASAVVGWPALLAMDLTREEQIQVRALADRNARLEAMGQGKECLP